MDNDMQLFIKEQIKLQFHEEKITDLKNKLNIDEFKSDVEQMGNATYESIDRLINNATIKDIQNFYVTKKLTCEELVIYYLKRIEKYDINNLNSLIELNPDIIKLAKEKDCEDLKGKLYGIPVILKDNIGTFGKMHTTAGAYALKDSILDADSFIVSKLKEEGALILGKANLSEWANFMAYDSSNGYSALGGQTHNPYGRYDVGGSSSGSCVSVASNFAQVAIGSETSGSIIYPASQNSVVGIKPSLGLVSRDRIIPITEAQDTAGVIGRTVEDVALVLEVISGYDSKDSETKDAESYKENYTNFLGKTSLKDTKIAVLESSMPREEENEILQRVEKELEKMGAEIIKTSFDSSLGDDIDYSFMRPSFRYDLNKYLKIANVKDINTINDIVEFNKDDLGNRAPFGQELLENSATADILLEDLNKIIDKNRKLTSNAIDKILEDAHVIISLSNETSGVYATAGYPAINVPAGYKTTGEPIGVTFVASKFEESKVIKIASVYEKNTCHRKSPNLK